MEFSHLHSHTQFSLLDGAASIKNLFKKAAADGHKGIAITDHGNMFGVFNFVAEAGKHPGVKPIVGCEFYMVEDRFKRSFTRGEKDERFHQLLLAKDEIGYQNLIKMCSLGYIDGLYGKYPRIDRKLIEQHHQGLIATTCCLAAEVPRTILKKGEAEAEKVFLWWKNLFEDDYYVELQRHGIPEQEIVNDVLIKFARKHKVKIIASNDSHYVDQSDANAHDILLCINTGEKQSTPTNKDFDDDSSSKGKRFAFFNDQFYFKTKEEMATVFHDLPEALDNTGEIVDKVKHLKLKQDILLPNFKVPPTFSTQDEYLRHLTFEGARKRYYELTPEIEERINFELFTIETMGFAGYFLIVQDFINKGREIGVFVGPGRGSAAGSVVAYCIGITNIDPIKYNLLFERFLNPDRKSMPDIDTDFDDIGRQKVIDYVVECYGRDQVAQIVTYGTMAAKMSIKDVARVMDLPLPDSNYLAKLVPERPGIELNRVLTAAIDGDGGLKDKYTLQPEEVESVKQLREILSGTDLRAKVLKEAMKLEGSVRGTGIHAAGIIIAPKDLKEIIPVATAKDSDLLVTQYEGKIIEDAGVIKMDFLGLKTLTILKDALEMIKENHGIDINLDEIPLDDPKTFALYQKAETNGTFQFESVGMQKHLKDLKPDKFEDLVAMNALFRPGPIQYIPNFIARKHGREKISYDLPEMEEYLADTYGITVYQEQVMLLSQKLAGFTKGDADTLRKAMGKKQKEVLDKMKSKFISGASEKGHEEKILEKIWTDWEAFAQYAFNKSHSVCYAFVAYQTGYLKAHYPAEYMAAVLSNNMANIDKITFFMEECKRMGIAVLGPDVNESNVKFTVNKKGEIRFAMSAIKGIGEGVVQEIVNERKANGSYSSIFDITTRVNLRTMTVKTLETLVYAGALDGFTNHHRAQYFAQYKDNTTVIEKAIKYGQQVNQLKNSNVVSLFGDTSDAEIPVPEIPVVPQWIEFDKLRKEKEVISIYLSGHPLDEFKYECAYYSNANLSELGDTETKDMHFAVLVTDVKKLVNQNGRPFARINVEDKSSNIEINFYGDDYNKFHSFLEQGYRLLISGGNKKPFRDSDRVQFKVSNIQFLQDLLEARVKSIQLLIDIRDINDTWVNQLTQIISQKKFAGNVPLKIFIIEQKIKEVQFASRKTLLRPEKELLDALNELPATSMKIENKKI